MGTDSSTDRVFALHDWGASGFFAHILGFVWPKSSQVMHLQLTAGVQTLKRWQHLLSPRKQITSGNDCQGLPWPVVNPGPASDPSRLPKQADSHLQHISSNTWCSGSWGWDRFQVVQRWWTDPCSHTQKLSKTCSSSAKSCLICLLGSLQSSLR